MMYGIIPNFALFDIKGAVVHKLAISPDIYWSATIYACCYASLLLIFSMIRFSARDFE